MSPEMAQVMGILTGHAQRLVQAEPFTVPGQVPPMLAALISHALKLCEGRLIAVEDLREFLPAAGTSICQVILNVPELERERIRGIQARNREHLAQRQAEAQRRLA